MNGIVGYQGSTNEHQVEIPRFPLSFGEIVGDDGSSSVSSYYFLEPNDTITFVCEDDTQMMKISDIPLEPHSVNFYTYTCSVEAQDQQEQDTNEEFVSIPLSCDNRETGRRQLLRRR